MSQDRQGGGWRAGSLLVIGAVVGAVATAAIVVFVADLIRGDAPTEATGPF